MGKLSDGAIKETDYYAKTENSLLSRNTIVAVFTLLPWNIPSSNWIKNTRLRRYSEMYGYICFCDMVSMTISPIQFFYLMGNLKAWHCKQAQRRLTQANTSRKTPSEIANRKSKAVAICTHGRVVRYSLAAAGVCVCVFACVCVWVYACVHASVLVCVCVCVVERLQLLQSCDLGLRIHMPVSMHGVHVVPHIWQLITEPLVCSMPRCKRREKPLVARNTTHHCVA